LKALQVHVSQLRKLVGRHRLETRAPGYLLRVERDALDLEHFQRLYGEGELDEALSLWRGSPLAEFACHRFAQAETARLQELHLGCLEDRIDRDLTRGRHAELVGELEGLVTGHALREQLRCQLMLALYRAGRQAEALDCYQQARAALTDDLGIEPGRQLRELHQAILNQDPSLDLPSQERPERTERVRDEKGRFQPKEETLKKLSLEELTQVKVTTESTLSRVDERVDEAPGSVYVYTREMIQTRGYRSLGELLQTVPGFTVFHKDLQLGFQAHV